MASESENSTDVGIQPFNMTLLERAAALTKAQVAMARRIANEADPGSGDDVDSPFFLGVLAAVASNFHALRTK